MPDLKTIPSIFKGDREVVRMYKGSIEVYSLGEEAFVSTWKTDNDGVTNDNQVSLPLENSGNYNFLADWGDGTSSLVVKGFDDKILSYVFYNNDLNKLRLRTEDFNFNLLFVKEKLTIFKNGLKLVEDVDYEVRDENNIVFSDFILPFDVVELITNAGLEEFNYFTFTSSGGETLISSDDNGNQINYVPNYFSLYKNGFLLQQTRDYVASDGSSINLVTPLQVNDVIQVFNYPESFYEGNSLLTSNYLASGGETSVQGSHLTNEILYDENFVFVHKNGVKLIKGEDYDVSSNNEIINLTPLVQNDDISITAVNNESLSLQERATHTYENIGTYNISLVGTIEGWRFNYGGDKDKIIDIIDFGSLRLGNNGFYFAGCTNLEISSSREINLEGTTNLDFAFSECKSLTNSSSLIRWDTSNIITMDSMFSGATNFNENLDRWDVSNVLDMRGMFSYAENFNQSLNSWDTQNVEDMSLMFEGAKSFNSNINSWNTKNVKDMSKMFQGAEVFNQPINNWNVRNVLNMSFMFDKAYSFNQNLNSWDPVQLTNANYMFREATSYNQPMDNWSTASLVFSEGMFENALSFNGDVTRWNTRNTENMDFMFRGAKQFNQPIGSWDVSSVTTARFMFDSAENFNASLSGWNTQNITTMEGMFRNAKSFEGTGIPNWNISGLNNVSSLSLFASGETSFTTKNYDAALISWSAGVDLGIYSNQIALNMGQTNYSSVEAANARQNLINAGWTITDGGQEEFISTWDTQNIGVSSGNQISLPLVLTGNYNFEVNWGDGNTDVITSYDQPEVTHTYSSPGSYDVSIKGNISGFNFQLGGDRLKLLNIDSFGPLNVGDGTISEDSFNGCENLTITASDPLDLEGATSISGLFSNCPSITSFPSLQNWDVSNVNDFSNLFRDSTLFNEDISMWNTENSTNMSFMFANTSFNQNIGDWSVKNVVDMSGMFENVTLSVFNYEKLLIGWNSQPLENNVVFDAGSSQYQSLEAQNARERISSVYNWTISDGGQV